MENKEIIVVCGLARCGTSLVMKMLHRGGIEPLCDPESLGTGYEYNTVLSLPTNTAALNGAEGKAVKILDPHRLQPPSGPSYAFILLTRDFREQSKSHVKFIKALGVPVMKGAAKRIERSLREDLPAVRRLLASYPNSRLLALTFEQILEDPLGSSRLLDDFLARPDFDMLKAAQCVLKRGPKCLPYLLELEDPQETRAVAIA